MDRFDHQVGQTNTFRPTILSVYWTMIAHFGVLCEQAVALLVIGRIATLAHLLDHNMPWCKPYEP